MVAIRGEQDAQVAAAKRKNAIEKEHASILKEQERLAKSAQTAARAAAAERERAIQQFNSRVVGAEGGTAQNPNSSAVGFGQFINSTWLEQFRKVFAEQAKGLSDQQILALRNNQQIAKAIIDNYARENARFLERFGQKVTAGNLYLTHFLGAGDALKVLKADGDTPVDKLLSNRVMQANRGYLYNNGRARTADELEKFIADRVGDTGQQQSAGQAAIAKLIEDQEKAQDRFNRSVEKANEERQRSIDAQRTMNGLQDTALIAAQREIEIAKAEFALRQQVADANTNLKPGQDPITLTEEQIRKTRELAAAEFDLARARDVAQAQTAEMQRPIDVLTAERDALRARIEYLNQNGLYDQAKSLVPDLTETNSKLREAIDAAIQFYEAIDLSNDAMQRTPEEIRATIEALRTAKDEAREWVNRFVINDLGDMTHYENFTGTTEASGHALDYDTRFPKMISTYSRVMRFIVDTVLTKADHVDVIINQGNHSRTNDIWMAELLRVAYAHTGRVNVLNNGSPFIGYRMGRTFVLTHHSDKCKPARLVDVMMSDFGIDSGECEYRYIDIGHIHHGMRMNELAGATVESWNTLAAKDKYAHDYGYRARQSISIVDRSRSYGDIGRRVLPIRRVRDLIRSTVDAGHYVPAEKRAYIV